MRRFDQVMLAVLVFAGINWGLWGVFEFNLVHYLFGKEWIDRLFYFIFGSSAVYMVVVWKKIVAIRSKTSRRRK